MTTTQNNAGSATGIDLAALTLHYKEGVENGGYYLATDVIRLIALARATPQHPEASADAVRAHQEFSDLLESQSGDTFNAVQQAFDLGMRAAATPQHSVTEQATAWLRAVEPGEIEDWPWPFTFVDPSANEAVLDLLNAFPVYRAQPLASTAAAQPEQASIKTWQERQDEDNEQWNASVYMRQEIADLRAALAIPASTAATQPEQNDIDMVKGALDLCEPEEQQAFQRILAIVKGANRG